MSDPRNVAHNKKVKQEKAHQHGDKAKPKKSRVARTANLSPNANQTPETPSPSPVVQAPGDLEKSEAVLSKLREMEFHSRANIETLAELQLTIEEELKQREFSDSLGQVYSAQDNFHSKIAELIQSYETRLGRMRSSA
jgi:hypothetical protein